MSGRRAEGHRRAEVRWRAWWPVVAVLVAFTLVAAACTDDDEAGPTTSSTEPVPPTAPPDYASVVHADVPGTTSTSIAIRPGRSFITGLVLGPDGPVPFAQIELVRMVGDGEAVEMLQSVQDGRWQAAEILGGRYRIRAWRPPDLSMTDPVIMFLNDGEQNNLNLQLRRFGGLVASSSMAPNPFDLDERVQLVVTVANRFVDERGAVRLQRLGNVPVRLAAGSAWEVESENPTRTGGDGNARWVLRCHSRGQHSLSVVVDRGEAGAEPVPLDVPSCGLPPTTTTQPPPTTSSSSSTSSTTDNAGRGRGGN